MVGLTQRSGSAVLLRNSVGSGWSSFPRGSLVYNNHDVNATDTTAMEFQIGLLPNLTLGLSGIFTASVGAEVYGEVDVDFTFPTFPAVPAPYQYNLNTSAPALLHTGDCSVPHFMEYQISVGVRNNRFDLAINFNLLDVLTYSFSYAMQNVAQLARFQLLMAGCALSDYNDSLSALGRTGDSAATFTLLFPASVAGGPAVRCGERVELAGHSILDWCSEGSGVVSKREKAAADRRAG